MQTQNDLSFVGFIRYCGLTEGDFAKVGKLLLFCVGFYVLPLVAVGLGFAKAQALVLYFFSPEKKYQKAGIRRSPL